MIRLHGIPLLGFGTFPLQGEEACRAVRMAIEVGARHIDTAQMYGNEAAVGRALRESDVPRREFFVVTKVDPGNVSKENFLPSIVRSLEVLDGAIDLLLIHWPPAEDMFDEATELLLETKERGMAAAIGVSNYTPKMMRRAYQRTGGAIINNQVEFHPLLDQRALVAEAARLGVVLSAFSPLARGAALKPEAIQAIARRISRSPSEVVLRWIVQQDVVAIPMTTKRQNAQSNMTVLDFKLSPQDMLEISALGTREGRLVNPGRMAAQWDDEDDFRVRSR